MSKTPFEIVYFNGGEVYKQNTRFDLVSQYEPDSGGSAAFPSKKKDGKRYFMTARSKQDFPVGDVELADLTQHNLCPAVTYWAGLGATTSSENNDCDLFFAVDSSAQLQTVATYYGLPYPVAQEVSHLIDTAPQAIQFRNHGVPMVLGAVKFVGGQPSVLKLYTYPKPFGSWEIWMAGASYHSGGQVWERGASYFRDTGGADVPGAIMRGRDGLRRAEIIYSERADGVRTKYTFVSGQAGIFWQGNEIDLNGDVIRVRRFEPSAMTRLMCGNLKGGPTFEDRNLCPAVTYWLGRAWYEETPEEELFFAVQSAAQLGQVAAYYGLPLPCSQAQAQKIQSSPELYRARHYDLHGLGPGRYVPVVVASVTFVSGQAARLLLYTFLRPWEFEDDLEVIPANPPLPQDHPT